MSTREKLIHARISMLALADELQSISRACKVAGISWSHFYEIKHAFEVRTGRARADRRRGAPRFSSFDKRSPAVFGEYGQSHRLSHQFRFVIG
jgi:hypothetical protein